MGGLSVIIWLDEIQLGRVAFGVCACTARLLVVVYPT
jgi:hypothetical protein